MEIYRECKEGRKGRGSNPKVEKGLITVSKDGPGLVPSKTSPTK